MARDNNTILTFRKRRRFIYERLDEIRSTVDELLDAIESGSATISQIAHLEACRAQRVQLLDEYHELEEEFMAAVLQRRLQGSQDGAAPLP
jgi:hypothetical protein